MLSLKLVRILEFSVLYLDYKDVELKKMKNLIILLRGEHNSIRYRFFLLPKEKLYYYWTRIKGNTWIDYYAQRLNEFAEKNNKIINKETYFSHGKETMAYLKKKGIKPNNSFLDFGCGFLRLGIVLIPYLQKGKYTGIDISKKRIEIGIKVLTEAGIAKNNYTTLVNDSNNIEKLIKNKFDYIYLESVITHMPKADYKKLLLSFSKILKHNGAIFFTFLQGDVYRVQGMKDFFYPFELIKDLAKKAGFEASIDLDWPDKNIPMVKLSFKNFKL